MPDWNDDLNGHKHLRNPTFAVSFVLVGGDVDNDTFLCLTREPSMLNGVELTNISLVRKGSLSGKGFLLRIFSYKVESHRKFSEIAPSFTHSVLRMQPLVLHCLAAVTQC